MNKTNTTIIILALVLTSIVSYLVIENNLFSSNSSNIVQLNYTIINIASFEGVYYNSNANGYWECMIAVENQYNYPLKNIKVRFNNTIVKQIPNIQGYTNEIVTIRTPIEYLDDNTVKQIGVDYFSSIEVYGYKWGKVNVVLWYMWG